MIDVTDVESKTHRIIISIFNLFLKTFGILNQANGEITQIKRLSWWSCQLNEYPSHKEPLKKIATSFWKKSRKDLIRKTVWQRTDIKKTLVKYVQLSVFGHFLNETRILWMPHRFVRLDTLGWDNFWTSIFISTQFVPVFYCYYNVEY